MEIWKDIKETNGIYKVSNLGNVKRVGNYKNQFTEWKKEHILKPGSNGSGYLHVQLSINNKIMKRYVHRLVADAFIPNPENKATVNHIDGNRKNNNVNNIEWSTYAENNMHSYKHLGKTNQNNKLSKPVLQYDLQGNFIKEYPSYREAYRQTKISAIDKVCNNKQNRTQAGGYVWKYKE